MGLYKNTATLILLVTPIVGGIQTQNHQSSKWWSRLIESPNIHEHPIPANRRSHSATVYRETDELDTDVKIREWMILTGGFEDNDWTSFPVWAYDMTSARSSDDFGENTSDRDEEVAVKSMPEKSPWIDLSGFGIGAKVPLGNQEYLDNTLDTTNNTAPGPRGRVGHLSSIYNDCLYVFGGLTYSFGSFHVENDRDEDQDDDNGEKNTIIVWRACGLRDIFSSNHQVNENDERLGLLSWERITPKVNTAIPNEPNTNETNDEGSSNHSAVDVSAPNTTSLQTEAAMLSRGEAQGGHYSPTLSASFKDCFIIYGGMHRHRTAVLENGAQAPSANNEVPLGDIWKYDYETQTLSLLAPYPPLDWQRDYTSTNTFPTARTSHAGTIVGNKLIIHGGMGSSSDDESDMNITEHKTFSYSDSSYVTYKTSPKWVALTDTWEFDLTTLTWKERVQYPQLARSYHSLVGWPDGSIAAFGGFQQDSNLGGEVVAFVFKDVILNRGNESHWMKLQSPYNQIANWRKYHYTMPGLGISNRLEHSAVLDQFGSMYVWGGRFQTVQQISGMWRLDLFNSDASLEFELAQPDGIEQYEEEVEALHMYIFLMMFASLASSSFYNIAQQRQAREASEEGNIGSTSPRRGGLSRNVINVLPLKHYNPGTEENNTASNDTSSLEVSEECCPICLSNYEEGYEIRSLPCGHDFCRECIDPWLEEHTSCPACRQRVDVSIVSNNDDSWFARIGKLYSPNRRNLRYSTANSSQADLSNVESRSDTQPSAADEWHGQDASRRSRFTLMGSHFRRSRTTHAAVPTSDTDGSLELV